MSKNVRTPDSCIREFIEKKMRGVKPYTRDKCRWSLQRSRRILEAGGFDSSPYKITEAAVFYICDYYRSRGKLDTYLKQEIAYLDRYLRFYGNDIVKDIGLRFSQDMRVNAHWLTEEQYQILMNVEKTPLQEMVIHLELRMGLRNAECCRLTLNEIVERRDNPFINVQGKGRGDGKYRSVAFNVETRKVLERWLAERAKIVKIARDCNPYWKDPGFLLLWCHYKNRPEVGYYKEHTGSLDDAVLDPLREKVGFHFCNHDLRRTFGRRLYSAGVKLEVISKFLGHESVAETIKYLGLNLDDMEGGMSLLEKFDKRMGVNVL